MQFRKIAAVAGSALLAGATLATAGLAATVNSVGEITSKLGEYPDFPVFVVGANAASSDVAGAIDVAVRLAANYKTTETVTVEGAGEEVTVTGGKMLETATKHLHFKDALNSTVQVLTDNELPELLASGKVTDEDSNDYEYDQYIRIGGKQITFDQPTTSDKDPEVLIRLGTSPSVGGDYLVQAEVVFDTPLNVSKAKDEEITLFGKTYTIAPESDNTKIVLYGSSDQVTINAGESATLKVGENEYTAEVIGIVDEDTAVLKVNGVTKEVNEGRSYDFGGVSVYVKDVFYYKVPTETGSVVISVGSEKLIFKNNDYVREGEDEDAIKGTKVSMSYSNYELSYLKIAFDAQDSNSNYIKEGETWTDPVFGTIKVAFNGLDSTGTEEIKVEPASTNTYRVVFTDKDGNSASVEFAYEDDPTQSSTDPELKDSNGYDYVVVEGQALDLYDYTILTAGDMYRLVQVTEIDATDNSGQTDSGTIKLKDVIAGTEFEIKITEDTDGSTWSGEKIIDGQTYYVQLSSDESKVYITWGNSASAGNVGDEVVVYPVLETSKGAKIALVKADAFSKTYTIADNDGSSNTDYALQETVKLPTGTVYVYTKDTNTAGSSFTEEVLVNTTGDSITLNSGTTHATLTVGNVDYYFDIGSSADNNNQVTLNISLSDQSGSELTNPAVMIVEEEDASDNENTIIIETDTDTDNDYVDLTSSSPILTDSNKVQETTSDTYTKKYIDTYGVKITLTNTNDQDTVEITYPDTQLVAKVAVGSDPQFQTGGGGGTVEYYEVKKVSEDIAKLDTEIDSTIKENYDLIVVGGPCVNRVAAELLGKTFPACGAASGIPENAALVRVFPDKYATGKTAVLIAGWTADNTKKACEMLMKDQITSTAKAVKIVDSTWEELTVEE